MGSFSLRIDVQQLVELGKVLVDLRLICHSKATVYLVPGTSEIEIPCCEWYGDKALH